MNIQESLDYYKDNILVVKEERTKLQAQAKELIVGWCHEVRPIIEFMQKNKISFSNPFISDAKTKHGIILGTTVRGWLIVSNGLDDTLLYTVHPVSDNIIEETPISFKDLVAVGDLQIAKAGIEYVRAYPEKAITDMQTANIELRDFLQA